MENTNSLFKLHSKISKHSLESLILLNENQYLLLNVELNKDGYGEFKIDKFTFCIKKLFKNNKNIYLISNKKNKTVELKTITTLSPEIKYKKIIDTKNQKINEKETIYKSNYSENLQNLDFESDNLQKKFKDEYRSFKEENIMNKKTSNIFDEIIQYNEFNKKLEKEKILPNNQELTTSRISKLKTTNTPKSLDINLFNLHNQEKWADPTIEASNFVSKREPTSFWYLSSANFKNFNSFTEDLKNFYNCDPKKINLILKKYDQENHLSVVNKLFSEHANVSNTPHFLNVLKDKIANLKEKDLFIDKYIFQVKEKLTKSGIFYEKSQEYVVAVSEKGEISKLLQTAKFNLINFENKISKFLKSHSNFEMNFYINIFGKNTLLSKYTDLIGDKIISLNTQINEIFFYYQEVEKAIISKIRKLHEDKKSYAKIKFLEEEKYIEDFLNDNKNTNFELEREKRKKYLQEVGEFQESSAIIQKKINDEYEKIKIFLEDVKNTKQIENYEDELIKLKKREFKFQQSKEKFEEYLQKLQLKTLSIEENYNNFLNTQNEVVSQFQKEIIDSHAETQNLMNKSVENLWNDWNENSKKFLDNVVGKNKQIISEFSQLVELQIKNIYKQQEKMLTNSKDRQIEWKRIFNEIKDEFNYLGYIAKNPQKIDWSKKTIKECNVKNLSLSNSAQKVLFYAPSFKKKFKKNSIIGLDPKTSKDEDFLVIDQVWTKLTKKQEQTLTDKFQKESTTSSKNINNKKNLFMQEKIQDKLNQAKSQFKKVNFFESWLNNHWNIKNSRRKIADFEKQSFFSWKEQNFTQSETIGQFKESIYNFGKSLFKLKKIDLINKKITITDVGLNSDDKTEIFNEKDYFTKKTMNDEFSLSNDIVDLSVEDAGIYDGNGDDCVELIDSFDEIMDIEESYKSNKKSPTLEEWAQISIKKFREKRKHIEIDEINDKLLRINDEIKKINNIYNTKKEELLSEIEKRNSYFDTMQKDLHEVQSFLNNSDQELNLIFKNNDTKIHDTIKETIKI